MFEGKIYEDCGFIVSATVTIGFPQFNRSRWKRENYEKNIFRILHDSCPRSSKALKQSSNGGGCEISSLLGSGGFGSVFEANLHGTKVAVKRIHRHRHSSTSRAFEETIEAEKLILPFRHRNLVRTFAVIEGESAMDVAIIMEFAGYKNLQTVIDDESEVMDLTRRTIFAHDIACALNFLHQNNIVHLDLKPANVIVGCDNTCKLGDFGCCQILEPLEELNDVVSPSSPTKSFLTGTFAFRAPELFKGEIPTQKADMYSLGILLWQMLTRERPYGLESQFVVIFGVVAYDLRPEMPQCVETTDSVQTQETNYVGLITSLWNGEPSRRPSAARVLEILRALRNT